MTQTHLCVQKGIQAYLICTLQILGVFCVLFFFNKLMVSGSPVPSGSVTSIFPRALTQFVSLLHFGNDLSISNFFMTILFTVVITDH